MAEFAGRAAIVTGGARGIGAAISAAFAAAGATVLVCGRTEPTSLPDGVVFVPADVRDAEQAAGVVTAALDRFGRLDVLVNNAGGSPDAPAATMSPRLAEKVVALNLLAPFYLAQAANAVMQAQEGGGAIVNIGSVAAHQAQAGTAPYAAAKAGLLQLTRALALEWAPAVRVNHVTVGLIGTHYTAAQEAAVAATVPMGRLATPADVADACLYLASARAAYVTGVDLAVHGGGEHPARWVVATP